MVEKFRGFTNTEGQSTQQRSMLIDGHLRQNYDQKGIGILPSAADFATAYIGPDTIAVITLGENGLGDGYRRLYEKVESGGEYTSADGANWKHRADIFDLDLDLLNTTIDRVTDLENLDAGSRLTQLETDVGTPVRSVYATVGAVQAADVPETFDFILTLEHTAGTGGGAVYRRAASEPSHPGKIQSNDGAWWEIDEPQITPNMLGAVGDGSTDDTVAVENALAVAVAQSVPVRLVAMYGVTTVDVDYNDLRIEGQGWSTGFVALGAGYAVESVFANRPSAASLEGVVLANFKISGGDWQTKTGSGIYLERFTRGCVVDHVRCEYLAGDGIYLKNSWSYSLKRNSVWLCDGIGINMTAANNGFDVSGCHVYGCSQGIVIENAQAGFVGGNASEYNKGTNVVLAGRSLKIVGNYFEGFHPDLVSQGGEATCVQLGSAAQPFAHSEFDNYVNGGSSGADSFDGDGIQLKNVVASRLTAAFSLSTRHEFRFDELDTCIGNEFVYAHDGKTSVTTGVIVRNTTEGASGGLELIKGTNAYNNVLRREGDTIGIRNEFQIKPNTQLGSYLDNRLLIDGVMKFRWGKLEMDSRAFMFTSDSVDDYYDFPKSLKIPVLTSTERGTITTPVPGMIIINSTDGRLEYYSGSSWKHLTGVTI